MPSARPAKIEFPLGGENRRGGYSQKTQPFTTPRAVNVRSVGPLERRGRGGSRPGLAKLVTDSFGTTITGLSSVSYLDENGTHQHVVVVIADGYLYIVNGSTVTTAVSYMVTDDGAYVVTDDGSYIVFDSQVASVNPLGNSNSFQIAEKGGKLYIADSVLKKFDPMTGVVENVTGAPASQPLLCVYQERLVLAGANHLFYMSGIDDDTDWSFAADLDDVSRAVAGRVGGSALTNALTAMLQFEDRVLVLATADTLHAIHGNPAGEGQNVTVSRFVGAISPGAMAITPDGLVILLSRNGLYSWQIGSQQEPQPFSPHVVPEELIDVDVTVIDVSMQYDHRSRGVHLFLTPASGVGTHWWIDLDHKALWPMKFAAGHQPLVVGAMKTSGFSNVLLGCKDGYVRRFSDEATTDDGTSFQSDVLFGPFHVSRAEGVDGMIAELVGALADGSGAVTWKIITGSSAEKAVDSAEAALDGDASIQIAATGTWTEGQNRVSYPRARGPWAVLWFSATTPWAFEAVTMHMAALGRLR